MANVQGAIEASMCKAYGCKADEWVRREAKQLEPATVTGPTFGPWADHDQRCRCTVCR